MICRFIDTHCHFDFPPFSGDEEASLQRAAQAGVGKIIVPATEAENFARVQALAEKYQPLYAALGLHPGMLEKHIDVSLDQLQQALERHPAKVVAVFTAIKNDPQLCHLTCLVDSNGMLSETGWEKLLPVCDGAMLDLKAWGSECHQQLTGRDNQQIKRSICLLAERGKLAELRLLVIPGQVDYLQHIEELAALIKGLGDVPVRLNAFHAHGVYGEAQSWPSATPEDVEQLADALRERGVSRLIFPALYL